MDQQQELHGFVIVWRGEKFVVSMNPSATLKELGKKLLELTDIDPDTLRLLIPSEKSSKLLYPFSHEHSILSLESVSAFKGKSIRMMGVPKGEIDEVLKSEKADLRIAGFDEEEKRLKLRISNGSRTISKLPRGNYIFCDFQTLSLPGIELNPPASKALELLHKLASDPGIVAIMNKHRWRVGLLTEMAPIGYVGVSPKCILGFNKNHGEEISLRLRTDDLKGFRKYESIKKTLCHELAHMVFSEHDSNFYALDKQLNEEAAALDWTKSRGHTLGRFSHLHDDEEFDDGSYVTSHELGGQAPIHPNARAASVNAAYERLANTPTNVSGSYEEHANAPGPDSDTHGVQSIPEPDPDDSKVIDSMVLEPYVESGWSPVNMDTDTHHGESSSLNIKTERCEQPDFQNLGIIREPKLDDSGEGQSHMRFHDAVLPDQMGSLPSTNSELLCQANSCPVEPHPHDAPAEYMQSEPDPDDPELKIIQDPVAMFCNRLQSAIDSLKHEAMPLEAGIVLRTLIKIICNIVDHPEDIKFKRLRKANPMIQKNIIKYKAAVDILGLIGFCERINMDELGRPQDLLMLNRNDPGLLWLAKSFLETHLNMANN